MQKLSPEAKQNKIKYQDEYNKAKYSRFDARIEPEVLERIENYCRHYEISKAEFLRRAIQELD